MKFGDNPAPKNKLAILKKKSIPLIIYKTSRKEPNKLLHADFPDDVNF